MTKVKTTLHGGKVYYTKECGVTNEEYSVSIPLVAYMTWRHGKELIQTVFPEMSQEDREFLISGTTPAEWEKMWEEKESK